MPCISSFPKHRRLKFFILCIMPGVSMPLFALSIILGAAEPPASNPITNYKSGISIGLSGQDGKDYAFECWYHDPLIDDHGVIYIRDTTPISFAHNERNTAWISPLFLFPSSLE